MSGCLTYLLCYWLDIGLVNVFIERCIFAGYKFLRSFNRRFDMWLVDVFIDPCNLITCKFSCFFYSWLNVWLVDICIEGLDYFFTYKGFGLLPPIRFFV